jgi:hypothetical protein
MVLYLPLYQGGTLPETVQQRRDRLVGWVAAPFRMQDLLQGMRQQLDKDIDLAIYDSPAVDAALRLTPPVDVPSGALEEVRWLEPGGGNGLWSCAPCPDLTSAGATRARAWLPCWVER